MTNEYTYQWARDGVAIPGATSSTYTIQDADEGDTLTCTVTATNSVGSSSATSLGIVVPNPPGSLTPPIGVQATPGIGQATITWLPPLLDGGAPITSYTVTASPGGAHVTVAAPTTTATLAGLTKGTAYTFTVTAANAIGSMPLGEAPFPSRVRIIQGQIVDANSNDLGTLAGFNVLVAPTVPSAPGSPASPSNAFVAGDNFYWSAADYMAMAAIGTRLVRQTIFWDVFEPDSLNLSSGVGEASHGNFDTGPIAALDAAIANARAAGIYTVLSLPHLLPGREPQWAVSAGGNSNGASPAASMNMLADWQLLGEDLTAFIAARYASNLAVIGCDINEPPTSNLAEIMTCYQTYVPWWQVHAPLWPVWASWSGYGGGTPSPVSGTQANAAMLVALDVQHRGCIFSWHDYLNSAGTYGAYQLAGTGNTGDIAPINQAPNAFTAEFHGWGNFWPYPNTSQTRTDFQNSASPQVKFAASAATLALAINEFGMDSMGGTTNELQWVADKTTTYHGSGAVTQLWWNYDTSAISSNGFSARPGGTWRPSILAWSTTMAGNTITPS